MVEVTVRSGEQLERALRRFKKKMGARRSFEREEAQVFLY
jgi:ribosomal protein S21